MRKLSVILFFFIGLILCSNAFAILSLELTRGIAGAVPIAIAPFAGGSSGDSVAEVITNDLQTSGRFKVFGRNAITSYPTAADNVQFSYFRNLGADNLVVGKVEAVGGDRYQVSFQLIDVTRGKDQGAQQAVSLTEKFTVPASQLRAVSHHISDLVYQHILGMRGVFSTRLAYVVVQRNSGAAPRYILEIADADGFNPKQLLSSPDPIMSPSWSPNGKQLAYVSFENRRASIYVQDVQTGGRRLVSQFKGINGAPAWSHDGRKLAVVLSKDGSPNIYVMDLASGQLTQMTHDWAINTEPAWSPDGRTIVFTSTRGGGPQIYQLNLATKAISRVSYDGDYNARASFTADGSHIAMLHREGGIYNIGMLDLDSGSFHLLTNAGTDDESPTIAPNGSVVLYGTLYNGRSVLGMVSSDSKVQMRLPARNGDVQDPSWSPFLS
ncbi:MAG: Tol-Pal system beta propeller repeat protein TolB [Pseudomonadota bacterium]